MITFIYNPTGGRAIPDGQVENEWNKVVRLKDSGLPLMTEYSTENIFSYARFQVVSGHIFEDEIKFVFEGKDIHINRFGAITDWPKGFCDSVIRMSEDILMLATKKSKEERLRELASMPRKTISFNDL